MKIGDSKTDGNQAVLRIEKKNPLLIDRICKGLTDFETTSVIPLGLELSEVNNCISVIYVCKFATGDKPVN